MLNKLIRLSKDAKDMLIYKIKSNKYRNNDKYKNMWLICERGTEAKDNGYWMFKYIRENYPEINVHYIIDESKKNDYNKVVKYGNIISFGSWEHKIAFILSDKVISTHRGFVEPWSYKLYKLILDRKNNKKFIFLQHGVTYNDVSKFLSKKELMADKLITSTKSEYNFIANNDKYGYQNGEVVQTGLPRFDNLHNSNPQKQILIMPTWRADITNPSYIKNKTIKDEAFLNSEYYNRYKSLLNNKVLLDEIKEKQYKIIFYPHYEIQQYINYFNTTNDNIIIANKEEYDVQKLLMDSNLLVTDYSSVFFDFAYMKKPIIHYCFDKLKHYESGYFDIEKDGFGKVISEEDEIVNGIIRYIRNDFEMEQIYQDRIDDTFNIRDNKNCERVFKEIQKVM